MKPYGKELILDIHECNVPLAFPRRDIENFFIQLCEKIDMERCELFWWDYADEPEEYKKAPPHLKGISAVQFIKTSNITIHILDELKKVYLNIFSCKNFNTNEAANFALLYFGGKTLHSTTLERI